jgi:predicted DsbA family dithiol-disulfide isomerase
MHDRLFANQRALAPSDLTDHARALGLDMPRFQQCLADGRHSGKIRRGVADGQAAGVRGTPSFFLGLTDPAGPKVKAVRTLRGAQPYAAFKEAIESLLSSRE